MAEERVEKGLSGGETPLDEETLKKVEKYVEEDLGSDPRQNWKEMVEAEPKAPQLFPESVADRMVSVELASPDSVALGVSA